jgi:hypothetical protein
VRQVVYLPERTKEHSCSEILQTDRQTNGRADGQTDRQTDRQFPCLHALIFEAQTAVNNTVSNEGRRAA